MRTVPILTCEQTCNILTIGDMKFITGPTMQRSCHWGVPIMNALKIRASHWGTCWHSVLHGGRVFGQSRQVATCWHKAWLRREENIFLLEGNVMAWPIKLATGSFSDRTLFCVHIAEACKRSSLLCTSNWFGRTKSLQCGQASMFMDFVQLKWRINIT